LGVPGFLTFDDWHHLKGFDVTVLRKDSPAIKPNPKGARFVFHEQVLRDQRNLTKYALALAGFIMHEPGTSDGVSFRVSLRKAERYLGIKRQHLQHARDLLAQRCHLIPVKEDTGVKGRRNQAARYFFGGGPVEEVRGMARLQGPDGPSRGATRPVGFSEGSLPKEESRRSLKLPLMRVVEGGR
jgi:hypothetical protein